MAKSGPIIVLIVLLCLFNLVSFTPVITFPEEVRWHQENIPLEGEDGGWLLAEGSDVRHLAITDDGALYACIDGLDYTLFRSTDGGYSWSQIGDVTDTIVDIASSTADASVIYYATAGNVFKSMDAGMSFSYMASIPALAGSSNKEITAIDVTCWNGNHIVIAGTRDTDTGEYGGVYILDESNPFSQWLDTDIGGYDVYSVAFSPDFVNDRQIVAVVTDETDSFTTTKTGDSGWGETIGDAILDKDNSGASLAVDISADIVFPDDYSALLGGGSYIHFVAVNTGGNNGDVYMIYADETSNSLVATDMNIGLSYGFSNIDVASLVACGNASSAILLAGAAGDGQVYRSYDGGDSWQRSLKEPTGQSDTIVLMPPGFLDNNTAYAATSGAGSALSVSGDGGLYWNQLGLVDTRIESIIDLAVSPDYNRDNTLFMLTWGGDFSLWRGDSDNARWERVFSSTSGGINSIDFVELSPQYGISRQVVYLAGSDAEGPVIWKSEDSGQSFICRNTPLYIDRWALVDDTTLFIAGYDGSNGIVYQTGNSGRSYSSAVVVGNQSLSSITLSPDYYQDGTVLVGNSNGWIFYSTDYGNSFELLPSGGVSPPLTGNISVAFDPQFGSNNTVYAASDSPDGSIYSFVIGISTNWQVIDDTLPPGAMVGWLDVSADGVLYAANFQQVNTGDEKGGIERCLEPASGSTFEMVIYGLDDGATMVGLWLSGNRIWSIDTTNLRLMTFIDSLAQPVSLESPLNQASGVGTVVNNAIEDVKLDWQTLGGATSYQWQLDDDSSFSSISEGFEDNTTASSVRLPHLEPDTTYYWRARAAKPLLSPWSAKWSFITSPEGDVLAAPVLESPEDGALDVPLQPLFQWSNVTGAGGYELMVSSSSDFSNTAINRVDDYALSINVWRSDISLLYGTTYYWKVRAFNSSAWSTWSEVAIFTVEPEPDAEPQQTSEPDSTPEGEPTTAIGSTIKPEVTLTPEPFIDPQPPPPTSRTTQAKTHTMVTEPPFSSPPPPFQPSSAIDNWIYYVMGVMGSMIALLLIIIMALMVRRRHIF